MSGFDPGRMQAWKAPSYGRAREDFANLRGRNLACWSKPDDPCHADVLLDLANRKLREEDGG